MSQNPIILYPSNWLYNAGVVGLIRVLDGLGAGIDLRPDGSVALTIPVTLDDEHIFKKWDQLSPKSKKGGSLVYGWKDAYYANQTEGSVRRRISSLLKGDAAKAEDGPSPPSPPQGSLLQGDPAKDGKEFSCVFCGKRVRTKKPVFLNQAYSRHLLGSEKSFSNMYWSFSATDFVCPGCEFIIMCHHLALFRLADGSEVFINAPSFTVMHYLNKFAFEAFGASSAEEAYEKRHILAVSLTEYAQKMETTLGVWTGMNIEIVSRLAKRSEKERDRIEFFSLPPEVVRVLSDRRIASLLSQIGEFVILNCVLDQDFSRLMEIGYRLLRIGLKNGEWGKAERDFLNHTVRLEKNRRNPAQTAEKIFKLCALIEEKTKRRHEYEWRSD